MEGDGHRIRCVTVKAGIVNTCPDCGHITVTDFSFDMGRDPVHGVPLIINSLESIEALKDLAPCVALPCLPDCDKPNEPRWL